MINNDQEYVQFIQDGKQQTIELSKCLCSGLIQDTYRQKTSKLVTIVMPKWVTSEANEIFLRFLKNNQAFDVRSQQIVSEHTLQRLLWLGDYFQIDQLQEKTIKDLIIERVNIENCILFLNESFKKLKACEESCDTWYMFLNTCMNFTAKNLTQIYVNNPADMSKINAKIIEEILDRALKYARRRGDPQQQQLLLQILFKIRGCKELIELINAQKLFLQNKKINFQNHPSINWKLSNLSAIINKETQSFKFSDYNWKLVAKMEEGNILNIFLKLEDEVLNETDDSGFISQPNPNPLRIISLYFLLSLNNAHTQPDFNYTLQVANMVATKGNKIQLCEFKGSELHKYDQLKLEFTVFLNTDQILTLSLNYLFNNLDFNSFNLSNLSFQDSLILLKATPKIQKQQEQALSLLLGFILIKQFSKQEIDIFLNCIDYPLLTQEFISNCITSTTNDQVKQYLTTILRKQQQSQSSNNRSYSIDPKVKNTTNNNATSRVLLQKFDELNTSDLRSASNERSTQHKKGGEMPLNKLEKLKKNSSQSKLALGANNNRGDDQQRRDSVYSQQSTNSYQQVQFQNKQYNSLVPTSKDQRKRQVLEEINIVNYLKVHDPHLVDELNEIMNQYLL